MANEAFAGLAGEIVELIEPHTEADKAALLLQLLGAFGNAAGRNAYYLVEESRHYPNLFVALVGDSSHARKGTSWDRVFAVMQAADPAWAENRVQSGLTSGEGLTWHVRDLDPGSGESNSATQNGQSDKRLLVVEGEMASLLKAMSRDGNTLSSVLRNAWDGRQLRTLTKQQPAKASGAHVSVIGHITAVELSKYLNGTESANGFGNRFLWACCTRARLLPNGGRIEPKMLQLMASKIKEALEFARDPRELVRESAAADLWAKCYSELTTDRPGLFGSVTSRAAPQVVRLSLVYALFGRSPVIRTMDLEAARAVWDFCESSARFIFGDGLGDPTEDRLRDELLEAAPRGLTRTEVQNTFNRHKSAREIRKAFNHLERLKLVHRKFFPSPHENGSLIERWFAGEDPAKSAN